MAVEVDVNPKWNSCNHCKASIPVLAVLDFDGWYSCGYCKSCLQEAVKALDDYETNLTLT